jgi:hypothetical protein
MSFGLAWRDLLHGISVKRLFSNGIATSGLENLWRLYGLSAALAA